MSTYKLADHQWQKLYAFLQGHPRAYAGQEEECRRFVELPKEMRQDVGELKKGMQTLLRLHGAL